MTHAYECHVPRAGSECRTGCFCRCHHSIGIPYAPVHIYDDGSAAALCPECGRTIVLTEMKDDESFSKAPYAEHWAQEHQQQGAIR